MNEKKNILNKIQNYLHEKNIEALLIPHSDPHLSEYVQDHWNYVKWISGFTGSAATMVISPYFSGLWTDSRYFIQAEEELKNTGTSLIKLNTPYSPEYIDWLENNLTEKSTIALPGHITGTGTVKKLKEIFEKNEINILGQFTALDELWSNRPKMQSKLLFQHEEKYSGQKYCEKLELILAHIQKNKATGILLSVLDEIAWLFNLRGGDFKYSPIFYSYAFISKEIQILFIDQKKINSETADYLSSNNIKIYPYQDIKNCSFISSKDKILVDQKTLNYSVHSKIEDIASAREAPSKIQGLKAIKNKTEMQNLKNCFQKDGVALIRFFQWLDTEIKQPKNIITEITAAEKLHDFRANGEHFISDSFETISAFKSHGAIVHYCATKKTDIPIDNSGMYLLDSGGQYFDGTTDITRTIHTGTPVDEMKRDYTLVLKGLISLSSIQFPENTSGYQLDILARQYLWNEGINYGHGTGHGVGYVLNVHEGPQNISSRAVQCPLKPGMVISVEPGVYKTGKYGIRIENLVIVKEQKETEFGKFFCFKTLTLCPFDKKLIVTHLLTEIEKTWIKLYYKMLNKTLVPKLSNAENTWLQYQLSLVDEFGG